jgi:hypothetical protein
MLHLGIVRTASDWNHLSDEMKIGVQKRDKAAARLIARFRCIKARTGYCNVPIQIQIVVGKTWLI